MLPPVYLHVCREHVFMICFDFVSVEEKIPIEGINKVPAYRATDNWYLFKFFCSMICCCLSSLLYFSLLLWVGFRYLGYRRYVLRIMYGHSKAQLTHNVFVISALIS